MNNIQDDEKDSMIKQKLDTDKLISKKYDDVFENFLKGDHEMKEESKIETKDEKNKSQKKKWVKPFATVAACALILTGANVYATTQGYDNIFFLIKDLGNKKTISAKKDEILTDVDTTISYTNIEISDGLFIQINKFVVKDGKASLFVSVSQEKSALIPDKFIVSANDVSLANEKIQEKNQKIYETSFDSNNVESITQYSYEIKLNNNYKNDMNVLKLRLEDKDAIEIATLEIDLKNREIDLISGNNSMEVKKISEVDLKEKLGAYTVMLNPYNYSYTDDIEKLYLGIFLTTDIPGEKAKESSDGFKYYSREKINKALKEAIGEELGTTVDSDEFEYNKELDAYKFIDTIEMLSCGLCLNIDDLKYEKGKYVVTFTYCMPSAQDYTNGTIESLDKFKSTLEFSLNEDESYTKYKILNIYTASTGIIDNSNSTTSNNSSNNASNNVSNNVSNNTTDNNSNSTNHKHQYSVLENMGHTSLVGTHTVKCDICGEEHQEPHNFGKWYTIYNGTAWTLWCKDCKQYVYTDDYDIVRKSGYEMENMDELENSDEDVFTPINPPEYDINKIDNYASTMDWTEYWAPGIKFQYPTDWQFSDTPRDGGKGIMVNAEATGWAIGINRDTNEPIESYMTIEVYDQVTVRGTDKEDAAKNFANEYGFELTGAGYTLDNGQEWYYCYDSSSIIDNSGEDSYYICLTEFYDADGLTGEYCVDMVRFVASDTSYKVTNITNKVIGSIKLTSK